MVSCGEAFGLDVLDARGAGILYEPWGGQRAGKEAGPGDTF